MLRTHGHGIWVWSSGKTPGLGPGNRGFKSLHPDQILCLRSDRKLDWCSGYCASFLDIGEQLMLVQKQSVPQSVVAGVTGVSTVAMLKIGDN